MKSTIVSGLLAASALFATPVASQEISVLQRVEMVPLVPGGAFHVSKSEADDLVTFACAVGPVGAIDEQLGKTESPCSTSANKEKRRYLQAGGFLYEINRVGSMFVYTMTKMGTGRNPNFQCQFNVLSNGQVTENQCVNTANGKMMFDAVLGAVISQTVPTVLGTLTANLTAPEAGDTNISVVGEAVSGSASKSGAQSDSDSNSLSGAKSDSGSNSSSTGGAGAPIHINNNPLFDVRAGAAATVNQSGSCGTPICL